MKKMMRMLFVGIILTATNSLNAQESVPVKRPDQRGDVTQTSPEDRARQRTDKMKTELTLDANQEAEIYAINLAHIVEMDKLRAEQKALKEKVKAERENTRAKIKGVLTPEQNVIFDQKCEEHKKKQEERKNSIEK